MNARISQVLLVVVGVLVAFLPIASIVASTGSSTDSGETLSDWVAILIALLAWRVSITEAAANQKQRELSVRPLLCAYRHRGHAQNDEDDNVVTVISFVLRNQGVGPALVNGYRFVINSKIHHLIKPSDIDTFGDALGIENAKWSFTSLSPPEPIAAGSSHKLFEVIDIELKDGVTLDDIDQKLKLHVEYSSIYETKFKGVL